MDCFAQKEEYAGYELKLLAGFGKGGEKNFDGVMADLQMQTYLVIKDFRRKKNKRGVEYGMLVSIYAMPEALWGYDWLSSYYNEDLQVSRQRIFDHVRAMYPQATEQQLMKVLM